MRLIINILSAILFVLILISGFRAIETGHYKLLAILMTAVVVVALKNNIKSRTTKMVISVTGAVLAILLFFLLP